MLLHMNIFNVRKYVSSQFVIFHINYRRQNTHYKHEMRKVCLQQIHNFLRLLIVHRHLDKCRHCQNYC